MYDYICSKGYLLARGLNLDIAQSKYARYSECAQLNNMLYSCNRAGVLWSIDILRTAQDRLEDVSQSCR